MTLGLWGFGMQCRGKGEGLEDWSLVIFLDPLGIWDSRGHACRKEKGCSTPNAEFLSSLCVRRGLSLSVGLDGGWTFPTGGRNLEMV
jgi:hypothetical protein